VAKAEEDLLGYMTYLEGNKKQEEVLEDIVDFEDYMWDPATGQGVTISGK